MLQQYSLKIFQYHSKRISLKLQDFDFFKISRFQVIMHIKFPKTMNLIEKMINTRNKDQNRNKAPKQWRKLSHEYKAITHHTEQCVTSNCQAH